MAAALDAAVRQVLREDLGEVTSALQRQGERTARLEESLAKLLPRTDALERLQASDARELRDGLGQQGSDIEALGARGKKDADTLHGMLSNLKTSLTEQLNRHENDDEFLGGLHRIRQRIEGMTQDISKIYSKQHDHSKALHEQSKLASAFTSSSTTRADALESALSDQAKKCEELQLALQACDVRVGELASNVGLVHERQDLIDETVARKYETLWEDVTCAIEDLKNSHMQALREDLTQRNLDVRKEVATNARYVTQMIATLHEERRKLMVSKDLMTVWREHTWGSVRRRMGIQKLHGLFQRRRRAAHGRWARAAAIQSLSRCLQERYGERLRECREDVVGQIPDVLRVLEGTGLRAACDKLRGSIEALEREKCSNAALQVAMSSAAAATETAVKNTAALTDQAIKSASLVEAKVHRVEAKVGACDGKIDAVDKKASSALDIRPQLLEYNEAMKSQLLERHDSLLSQHGSLKSQLLELASQLLEQRESVAQAHESLTESHDQHGRHQCSLEGIGAKLDEHGQRFSAEIAALQERVARHAKTSEVQSMVKDILLVWTSIKQLDAAKADKKDIDMFAIETGNRDKQSTRRAEDLQSELQAIVREETLQVHEKWQQLDSKMDESTRQLREQFSHWAQMWEKLAGTVEELVPTIRELQGAGKLPATPSLPGGAAAAAPRRPASASRSRAEIPTVPIQATIDKGSINCCSVTSLSRRASGADAAAADPRLAWAGGNPTARGAAEPGIDHTLEPKVLSARPRSSRPKSASSRRPHDRGRC